MFGKGDESDRLLTTATDDYSDGSFHSGEKKTSNWGAIFNFICTTLGAGILSLPNALMFAGWFGVFFLIILGIVSNYTAKMLIACMHLVPQRRLRTYEEVGYACFGKIGSIIVGIFQILQLFGVCVIFLILIGGNMTQLVTNSCLTYHDWILIFTAVLLPFTWLKTMREISFVAVFGLLASLIVAVAVVIVGLYQTIDNRNNGVINTHVFFTNFAGVVKSFDTAIFSFGVHSVLPTLEYSMAQPAAFPVVSNISFLVITQVYVFVALAGYAGWGETLVANGTILSRMSLSYGSTGFLAVLIKVVIAIITVHVIMAFPLPMNPINLTLENTLNFESLPRKRELVFRVVLRTCVVALAVLVASVVPFFGIFLELISALAGISVAFILPVFFYFVLCRKHGHHIARFDLVCMGLVFVIGILGMGVGLYYSINDLIENLHGNPFEGFFTSCATSSAS
eukprot:TRINITY_DN8787_c0_g1_i1.p1 TRINITY_DN8787_c0_g1~~TRINITY_DN8787_c0_g1_i1.p1  ORF type:complete len:453 (-),score=79.59 TRINITY_DN8787_c0_g1_i1:144-1502(-)